MSSLTSLETRIAAVGSLEGGRPSLVVARQGVVAVVVRRV